MPHEIVWEPPNGVVMRFAGSTAVDDVLEAARAVEADPSFHALRYRIIDYLHAALPPLAQCDIDRLVEANAAQSRRNPRILEAFVIADAGLLAAWWKGISTMPRPLMFAQFPSVERARAWIDRQRLTW